MDYNYHLKGSRFLRRCPSLGIITVELLKKRTQTSELVGFPELKPYNKNSETSDENPETAMLKLAFAGTVKTTCNWTF